MRLCFATNNAHKLEEVQNMLGDRFELVTLEEIGCTEDIPEDFDTIPENSHTKAEYVYKRFGINCFADDSGLIVDALDGEPGVKSARYAGPQRNSQDNIHLLLQNLEGKQDRSARFITVITLVMDGVYHQFEGTVEGRIIYEPIGDQGFGYDPVFVPDGSDKTFAQISLQEKSKMSHRAKAFTKLIEFLQIS